MANLPESSVWEAGVYQLETTDPVIGGPEGVDNKQAKQLANRTAYLKGVADALTSGATPAGKANEWATARSISMMGDGTWTVTANGSGNVTAAMTLANSGVAAGSYSKVTVDSKGRVTAGAEQTAADIPALDWSKITTGKPTTLAGYGITDASGPTIKPTFAQAVMVADPVNAMETATKQYVDNMASGIQVKQSAHAATTGNITLSGLQTIDGVLLVAGDRVLVKAQTTASQNGIYIASAGVWSRPSGADTWPELISAFCFVEEGAVNADTGWVCTINAGGTLGSSAIAWTQFAGVGTVSAGTGLSISGNQVSLGTPSTLNGASTNSASGQTHTHAVAAATETVAGVSEMATQEETNGCVDGTRSVTPKTLSGFSMETGSISFVSPGVHTFNVPDVVRLGGKKAKVICTGGSGSGGGGSASSPQSGGGGGAGGTAIRVLSLKGVSTVTVTVGVQGITAANQPTGVNGGASSFGIYLSASGGSGATGPIGNSGGQGGVGQGGDINIYGGWGGDGLVSSLERGSGYGGGSFWGGGGRSSPTQESHPAAFGGGGGGSSAGIGNGNNATGGAVYIEW